MSICKMPDILNCDNNVKHRMPLTPSAVIAAAVANQYSPPGNQPQHMTHNADTAFKVVFYVVSVPPPPHPSTISSP